MTIDPSKYVVFKREDIAQDDLGHEVFWAHAELDDCVVIRLQDVFAGPALHAYAAGIRTAIEIASHDDVDFAALEELADYFHECAVAADRHRERKVPD